MENVAWFMAGVFWSLAFAVLFFAAGCSSPDFGYARELEQQLSGAPQCRLSGQYIILMKSLDRTCNADTGSYQRFDEQSDGPCSWEMNGHAGTVTCDEGNPVMHCEGETSRPYTGDDRVETCWFEVRVERIAE